MDVAINRINKEGGVLGCPISLDAKDDESDYTKDLPLMTEAVATTDYAMVTNPDYGCSSTAPFITREKLLSISGCAAPKVAVPSINPTIFDTVYLAARNDGAAAEYMLKKGYKKIAIVTDNEAVGNAVSSTMESIISEGGGEVSDVEQVPLSGVDFTPAVVRARASDPEVLFVDLFGAAAGHFATDLHTSEWEIPVVGGQTISATSFKNLVPEAYVSKWTMIAAASMSEPSSPSTQAFLEELKPTIQVKNSMFIYTEGNDQITLFAWAANETESLDPTTIAEFLASHGTVEVPHLAGAKATGYVPELHEWNPPSGLAVMQGGFYNEGRLKNIGGFLTAPKLEESQW